ncbi:MAG: hypothetical protein V8R60_08785 [Faecalibacterium sp.]
MSSARTATEDRLKKTSLAVTVGGINISRFTQMSVKEELAFLDGIALTEREHLIGDPHPQRDPGTAGLFAERGAGST